MSSSNQQTSTTSNTTSNSSTNTGGTSSASSNDSSQRRAGGKPTPKGKGQSQSQQQQVHFRPKENQQSQQHKDSKDRESGKSEKQEQQSTNGQPKQRGKGKGHGGQNRPDSPHLEALSLGPRLKILEKYAQMRDQTELREKREKLQSQLGEMVANLEMECYTIIFDLFPEKILKFDDLFKNRKEFNLTPSEVFQPIEVPTDIKGDKDEVELILRQNVKVPANKAISKLLTFLQTELLELSEMLTSLSIWVKLNVPRISDGNNFGVEVQGEILEELESASESCFAVLDAFTTYEIGRGELIEKILHWPGIEDYRNALKELDEKQYIKIANLAGGLRNDVITLYDLVSKNLEVLVAPRGQEEGFKSMY